jgi:hypothetical protein
MVKIIRGENRFLVENVFTQLTAAGATDALEVLYIRNHTFQVKVASINTNIAVRCEGSLDGTNWFNLYDSEANTTITADGTYLFHKSQFTTKYVRFYFVSESGGTAATIDIHYLGTS